MARVLIVSSRLPVTVHTGPGGLEVEPSVGGLATGLRGPHDRSGGLWIGWPGLVDPLSEADGRALAERLEAMRRVQVPLSAEEVHRYYEAYSNGELWPVFHDLANQLPLEIRRYSGSLIPVPPSSAGMSFIFGSPSRIRSTAPA